jgi:hypothetical protein
MHPTFSPMCLSCESSNCADLYQARIHAGHRPRSGPQTCPPHAGLLRGRGGRGGGMLTPLSKKRGLSPAANRAFVTLLLSGLLPPALSLPSPPSPPLGWGRTSCRHTRPLVVVSRHQPRDGPAPNSRPSPQDSTPRPQQDRAPP